MKERKGEHPYGDAGQIILLVVFMAVWIADSFFLRRTTFLAGGTPLSIRLVICGLLTVIGVLLARSGHRVVEHPERPDHVVQSGAFRYVRHPLYLASILFYFSLLVSTVSIACALLLIVIVVFYNYIAKYEEILLMRRFGEEYARYRVLTGKWLPRPGRRAGSWG